MHYLVVANLLLSVALIATAIGVGLFFYLKRRIRKLASNLPGDPSRDYAAPSTGRRSAGSLNYSSFVYLDVDRDGHYGLGDRPMGGIMVRLSGKDGHLLSSRTNGNGFANFTMSVKSRPAQIREPGTYKFSVSVPPGWVTTSKNDIQSMPFHLIAGSPAGIGSAEMIKPVGIAPVRHATGRTGDGVAATITAVKNGVTVGSERLADHSEFLFQIPETADTLVIEAAGIHRKLALSSYVTELGLISPVRPQASGTSSVTIDFNEVTSRGLRKIPSGYAGLNWFNLNAISRDFQGGSEGYVNGNTSGDHMCYTSSGHPGEFWSETPFDFHSVMLSSAWLRSEGEIAKVESWSGDTLVASDEIVVSSLAPVHYAPLLKGITRVRISSKRYWQIGIDDLVLG